MRDTDKVRFINSPVSQDRPLWRRGRELRPAVLGCTEAVRGNYSLPAMAVRCCIHPAAGSTSACSSSRATTCGCPLLPRCSSSLHPSGAVEPVVSGVPSPFRPPPRGAAKPRARGPRTGDPEMVRTALQEMVTAPLLPPEEGRVVSPFSFCHCFNDISVIISVFDKTYSR